MSAGALVPSYILPLKLPNTSALIRIKLSSHWTVFPLQWLLVSKLYPYHFN